MGKINKKKNVKKIGTGSIVVIAIVLGVVIYGLKLVTTGTLSNSRVFKNLVASITGKSSYTVDDKIDAVIETADAYKDRGANIQYDTFKKTYLADPEDATDDDVKYTDGGAFVYSVYKKALGINIAPTSEALMDYINDNEDSDYVVAKFNNSKYDDVNGYIVDTDEGDYKNETTLLNDIKSAVHKGDIIVFKRRNTDTSIFNHAVIVYSVESNDVKVINARGYSYFAPTPDNSTPETLYEEAGEFIANDENTNHYDGYIEGVSTSTPNESIGVDNLSTLLNTFTHTNTLDVGIMRPLGSDGTTFQKSDSTTEEINVTDAAKARLEYKDIKITKTSNKYDNTTISAGDEITYTIKIKNQGSSAYSTVTVTENISEAGTVTDAGGGNVTTSNGTSTIVWNNISVSAGNEHTITYKVKVKADSKYVNNSITSTGNVDGISTGTIENTILYTLTDTQKTTLNNATPTGTGVEYINNWYNTLGISLGLTGTMTIDSVYSNDDLRSMIPNNIYASSISDLSNRMINYSDTETYGLSSFNGNYIPYNSIDKNLITGDIIFTREYVNSVIVDKIYYVKSNNIYDATNNTSVYPSNKEFIENLYGKTEFAVIRPSILMPTLVDISSRTLNVGVGKSLTTTAKIYKEDSKFLNTITWSSSDTSKITVDSTGKLTGVAAGTATITATAANGITDSKTFTCKTSVDNDATLSSLSLKTTEYTESGAQETNIAISPAFSSSTTSYTATVPLTNTATYIEVTAVATKSSSSIEIEAPATEDYNAGNQIFLNPGNNTINVKVIAEDETTKTYTITVDKKFTDSNLLSTLWVSGGDLSPEFSPNTTVYSTTVVADDSDTPNVIPADFEVYITALPELWAGATVVIEEPATYDFGNNVFYVKCSGVSLPEKTYTINVNIEHAVYTSNKLRSIKIQKNDGSQEAIEGFDPDINNYVLPIDDDVTSIRIYPEAQYSGATIGEITKDPSEITPETSSVTFSIPVTAASGGEENIYTVTFVREGSTESRLRSINIKDDENNDLNLIPNFNSDVFNYTLNVDYDVNSISITAIPLKSYANVTIQAPDALEVGENTIKIAVYASGSYSTCDGDECTEEGASIYTITVKRSASSYNKLTSLSVQDYSINPNFDPDVTGYTLSVPNSVSSIIINAENSEPYNVEITGDGAKDLAVGPNVFDINVKADNNDVRTYKITVTRQSDVSYDDIEIDGDMAIVSDEVTVSELIQKEGSGSASVLDSNKNAKNNSSQVSTGDYLRVGSFDYKVVILGDFNQDGYVDDGDVYDMFIYTYNDIFGLTNSSATDAQLKAGDFNKDTSFDDGDVYDLYIYTYNKIFGGE